MESFKTERISQCHSSLVSDADRTRLEDQAHRLQNVAIHQMATAVGRVIGAIFRGIVDFAGAFGEGVTAARLYEDLCRRGDAGLAELGITRREISRYVADSIGRQPRREAAVPSEAGQSADDDSRGEPPVPANDPRSHSHAA